MAGRTNCNRVVATAMMVLVLAMAGAVAGATAGASRSRDPYDLPVHDQGLVNAINANKPGWKAAMNPRFAGRTWNDVRKMFVSGEDMEAARTAMKARIRPYDVRSLADVPTDLSFDARTAWPNCPTISGIRNQATCGACWAFSSTEAMSDRMCIAGGPKVLLSPQYLVSCDSDGGSAPGCGGSTLVDAWISLENGVVADSCFPYVSGQGELFPCPSWSGCFGNSSVRPAWYYAKAKSSVMLPSVAAIKASIQTFGPVSAGMDVYQDFMTYKSGVYRHVTGDYIGGHAVKLIGWGSDNGTDYWIAANSWSPQWGIDGFFYILQGADECKIEQGVFVGEYGWHNGTTAPTSTGYASSTTGGSHNNNFNPDVIEALDDFDMVARYVTFTLLVILGLLFACGGRRYEPPFLSTMGFCVMAVVVYTVLGQATVWQTWTNYLCAILAGLIFTFFVDKIKVLGFFCSGVALACVVASIALSDASVYTFAARNAIPIAIGLALVAVLLGGSLAALGAKSVVVVSAIIGSYMVAVGLDFFALKVAPGANETLGFCVNSTGRISEMLGADTRLEPPAPPSTAAGVWLVAVVAVALAGIVVQALWCKPVKRTPAWGGKTRASVNAEVRYRPLVPTSNYSYSDM